LRGSLYLRESLHFSTPERIYTPEPNWGAEILRGCDGLAFGGDGDVFADEDPYT
jgi:hypothetical protein